MPVALAVFYTANSDAILGSVKVLMHKTRVLEWLQTWGFEAEAAELM